MSDKTENQDHAPEIDDVTGVETTGHEWDGIKELNKPLPAWWLYVFYVSIIWAFAYWVFYPAWPTLNGYTQGILGFSQRQAVTEAVAANREGQSKFREAIAKAELTAISKDPELLRFAVAGGKAMFGENCAGCHGRGAQGFEGYPNLNDDDWIWGGSLDAIHQTILHGIRANNDDTRDSAMPQFGIDEILEPKQIDDTAVYVMSLSSTVDDAEAAARGKEIYLEQCAACHGDNGEGNIELGAPNLADSIWLYGGDKDDIKTSIHTGRGGMMPGWTERLDPVTIKSLAVYVHSLGGGT
ncbi:MAG: cytochrome-c oxidase, cbb3-type subunit III [Pseudomonadota bacterium]